MTEHLSSSRVQGEVEAVIVAALAGNLGIELVLKPGKLKLSGGTHIEVDAASPSWDVVVEAYARQGKLHGAQTKKIAQDILKLALLKAQEGRQQTRTIIAFASSEARESITGWIQQAATSFDVELRVVEIPQELRDQIRSAQHRQVMVNLDVVADDIDAPETPDTSKSPVDATDQGAIQHER